MITQNYYNSKRYYSLIKDLVIWFTILFDFYFVISAKCKLILCLKFSFNSLGTGKKIWHFSMRHIQIWRHAFFCQKVLKYFKDFVLKIKCNLCLFALSWFEIKHKTRHYQGQNSFIFTYKMCNEKIIKRKIVNLQMRKNKLAGWKVLKQFFNTYLECLSFWVRASFPYTQNWNWLQWIKLEKFDCIVHFKEFQILKITS